MLAYIIHRIWQFFPTLLGVVLLVFVLAVLFAGLLLSYPWEVLAAGSFLYLAAIPVAYFHYKKLERTHLVASGGVMPQPPAAEAEQRPERLN